MKTLAYRNRILRGLPPTETRQILPHLRPIVLRKDAVLYEAGQYINQVYFPDEAMVSYLSETSAGDSIEVCIVGNEGVVGITSLIRDPTAFRAVVQIPGRAYAVNCEFLRKEFGRCDVIHRILLHYTNALLIQLAQTAVCNKFHSVEERFCRWLLMAHETTSSDSIPMTQDALARVLGSRRASISDVAGCFQKSGTIQYSRGIIRILVRKRLEAEACECYKTISAAHVK